MNAILALLVLALMAFGIMSVGSTVQTSAITSATPEDTMKLTGQAPTITHHIDPTDITSWPSGDRIWDCCRAIAIAEGYNVFNSVSARLNNPGDLSDGREVYGSEFHDGSEVTKFPDAVTGWSWLYNKINNIVRGKSSVYNPDMSWNEIGTKWAGNAATWSANVANNLGVDADSSLNDYVNA